MGANWSFVGSRLLAALSLCPCVARLRVSPARVFVLDKVAFYTSANTTYHGLLPSSQLQIEGVTGMAEPQVHFCLGLRRILVMVPSPDLTLDSHTPGPAFSRWHIGLCVPISCAHHMPPDQNLRKIAKGEIGNAYFPFNSLTDSS